MCISTLRTVPIANKDDRYQEVMEGSLMNTPDGTPLVWCGHWWGLKDVQRACGPHIFPRMLKDRDPELMAAMPYAQSQNSLVLLHHWSERFERGNGIS